MSAKTRPTTGDELLTASDMDHMVCCRNADVSLCGLDASQMEWHDNDEPDCVVCYEIQEETDTCPLGGTCALYLDEVARS